MGFLLVIPAVVLAASFLNMVEYGGVGSGIVVLGDNLFYNGQNIITFLEDAARAGELSFAVGEAEAFASGSGKELTIQSLSCTSSNIFFLSSTGAAVNKTFPLKNGTLQVNLSLSGYNITALGRLIYMRGTTINTTTNVTYQNGSCVDFANVYIETLGTTNTISTANPCGIFRYEKGITGDTGDACENKNDIGGAVVEATSSTECYYNGSETEDIRISMLINIGDMAATDYGPTLVHGETFNIEFRLYDDLGDPISIIEEADCDNYSIGYPEITLTINASGDITTFTYGNNIEDDGGVPGIGDGYYITNETLTYDNTKVYNYTICVNQTDYVNATGDDNHCESGTLIGGAAAANIDVEFEDPIGWFGDDGRGGSGTTKTCKSTATGNQGIGVWVENVGTTDVDEIDARFEYDGTEYFDETIVTTSGQCSLDVGGRFYLLVTNKDKVAAGYAQLTANITRTLPSESSGNLGNNYKTLP